MGKFPSLILLLFIPLSEAACPTALPTDAIFTSPNQYHSGTNGTAPSAHLLSYSNPSTSTYCLTYPITSGSFLKAPSTQCPQSCLIRLRAMGKGKGEDINSIVMVADEGQSPPGTNILYSAYTTTVVPGEYFYCSSLVQTCGASIPLYLYYNSRTDDYQVRGLSDENDDEGAQLANQGRPICYLFPPVTTTTSTSTYSNSSSQSNRTNRVNGGNRTVETQKNTEKQMKGVSLNSGKIRPTQSTNGNWSDSGDRMGLNPDFGRFANRSRVPNFNKTEGSLFGPNLMKTSNLSENGTTDVEPDPTTRPTRYSRKESNSPRNRYTLSTVLPSFPQGHVSKGTSGSVAGGNGNGISAESEEKDKEEEKKKAKNQQRMNLAGSLGGLNLKSNVLSSLGGKVVENLKDLKDSLPSNVSLNDLVSQLDGNQTIGALFDTIPKESIEKNLKHLGIKLPVNVTVEEVDEMLEEIKKAKGEINIEDAVQSGLVNDALKSLGIDIPSNFSLSDLLEGMENESAMGEKKKWIDTLADKLIQALNETRLNSINHHVSESPFGGKGVGRSPTTKHPRYSPSKTPFHSTTPRGKGAEYHLSEGPSLSTRLPEHNTPRDSGRNASSLKESLDNGTLDQLETILERLNLTLNDTSSFHTENGEDGLKMVATLSLPENISESEVDAMMKESGVRVNGTRLSIQIPLLEENGKDEDGDHSIRSTSLPLTSFDRSTGAWMGTGGVTGQGKTENGGRSTEEERQTSVEWNGDDVTRGLGSGETRSDGEVKEGRMTSPDSITKDFARSTRSEGGMNGSSHDLTGEDYSHPSTDLMREASTGPSRAINGMSTEYGTNPIILKNTASGKVSSTTVSSLSSTTGAGSSSTTSPLYSMSTTTTTYYTGPSTTSDPSVSTTYRPPIVYTGPSTTADPYKTTTSGPQTTAYTGPSTTADPFKTTTSGPSTTAYTGPSTTFDPSKSTTSGPSTTAYTGLSTTVSLSTTSTIGPSNSTGSSTTTPKPSTTTSPYVYSATTDTSGTYGPGDQKLENGTIVRPNGDMIYPNGTVKNADGSVIENGKKTDADGTVHNPDGSTVYPNGTVVYPPSSESSTGSGSSGDDTPGWIIPVIIIATILIGIGALGMIFFGVTSMMKGTPSSAVNPYQNPNGDQWPNQKSPSPSADLPPSIAQPVTTAQPQSFGATQSLAAPNSLYFG